LVLSHKTKNQKETKRKIQMKTQLNAAFQRCFAAAALALFVAACQKQPPASAAADPAGVYTLVSVDGKPVPASVSHGGAAMQVRSGTFTITADGSCSSRILFVAPSGEEATREVSATYTRDGSQLRMQWKGAGRTVGTVDGQIFTMNNEGMLFVYKK
jgi:hypothetical protein